MIAETCHPIDLATFRDARAGGRALPERPVLVTFDDGYRSVFELARPILRRYRIPAAVFVCSEPVRRQRLFWFDAVTRALGPDAFDAIRAQPGRGLAASGGRARHAGQRRAGDRADDRGAGAPARRRRVRDRGPHGVSRAARPRARGRPARRARIVPIGARIVDRSSRRCAWRIRSARPAPTTPRKPSRLQRSLGFTAGFTTRNDFARANEPALERSRFVVLAAVTAAELAHRITYAWPR